MTARRAGRLSTVLMVMRVAGILAAIALAGATGVSWYTWTTIDDMRSELEALEAAVEKAAQRTDSSPPDPPDLSRLDDIEEELAAIGQELRELRRQIGTSPFVGDESLWETIDILIDQIEAVPALVAAMIAAVEPQPMESDPGPSTEWCAMYRLALENAGNAHARAQGLRGMNRGIYIEWVVDPLEEVGCPRPAGY